MFVRRDYIRDYMMIPPGTGEAAVVNVIVEIPKGKRNKFEVDKVTGLIKLDRYLYSSAVYPGDYGFIPQTLAEDNDPLDALVMVNEPTFSGCLIEARVVGMFRMRDKGQNDYKILAVPHKDPLFAHIRQLSDVPAHFIREVEFFFTTYKQLEGVTIEPIGWDSTEDGTAEVRASVERFRASLGSVLG
ncbi:MAG: inorganic diphosphatase [Gemmataceae bacterium]|nr:inorganic diphosphatase [Gemmata sp.]MDW8198188.1 inorganic diphosphatase [Gemmataceae bacterium]